MSQIIGHISQVIGPVVDVYFEGTDAELMLPSIHDALEIKRSNGITHYIHQPTFNLVAHRHSNRTACGMYFHTSLQTVRTIHGYGPHRILANVLLHFYD